MDDTVKNLTELARQSAEAAATIDTLKRELIGRGWNETAAEQATIAVLYSSAQGGAK